MKIFLFFTLTSLSIFAQNGNGFLGQPSGGFGKPGSSIGSGNGQMGTNQLGRPGVSLGNPSTSYGKPGQPMDVQHLPPNPHNGDSGNSPIDKK